MPSATRRVRATAPVLLIAFALGGCAASACSTDTDLSPEAEQKASTYEAIAKSYRFTNEDRLAEPYEKAARNIRRDAEADEDEDIADPDWWLGQLIGGLLFGSQSCDE